MDKDLKVIDCFGDICPVPMLKIERELKSMKSDDEFMLVTDHSCTLESIRDKYQHLVTKTDEVMNGVWEIYFRKN